MVDALKDKVAIVTGAGRGIGRGVALALAQEGASVVVNDPGVAMDGTGGSRSPADDVVAEIQKAGGRAVAHFGDVVEMKTGEDLVKTALDRFGRLDGVVTCHGILRDRMVFNMAEAEWDAVIAVHLKGTFTVCKHAAILFRQQRSGSIVTFSSESGLTGNSGQANYGAAKSGIAGFTKVVARDLGRYGVTVNCIAPRAWTRMTQGVPQAAREMRAQRGIAGIEDLEEGVQQWQPEDIGPFTAFLLSDFAANVNGQVFLVYGNTVSLLAQPRLVKTIFKPAGIWTVDELRRILPRTLVKDLVNPAPPQPPRV
ncbi:MAG: SDR family oxidoreductase [Chloroflexi bacterium]|nr:SDR family oxidoreductase [Chloroflexota bacterium]